MKIGMVSLGCAKNQTDAEIMLGILAEKGHKIVAEPKDAEAIIVNTCGFITPAKQESIDAILEMAEYKKSGKCRLLIATGCLAERYNTEMEREIPELDAVVGTGDFDRIDEIIKKSEEGEKICLFGHQNYTLPENLPRILTTPFYTAYLKIADGCDNNCTYCAIPKIRGHYKSRKEEDILAEAERLAKSGVKELILIAQDTTRYGIDIYKKPSLAGLLQKLCKIDGIHWIRIHYFYTEAITDELISVMAENEKICPYVDMPIQHINDDILRRMARRTNRKEIEKRISDLRKRIPDVTIRTSIIAGFPAETEEQFCELKEFIKQIKFDRMGVFAYSKEEDTPAYNFPCQIEDAEKERRKNELMEIQQGISLEKNTEKIGTVQEVLCEGYDSENFMYFGRSRADSIDVDGKVYFAAEDEVEIGTFVKVEILNADEYDLIGKSK
ncbi:MAG: 30S ribosomal protein S12 methylthiotransferase RimO [Clostridia bacterium]|nr:30S ribosomal protein S12 methylthiotransferase RimO [Clostridia bacterium]MBQ7751514.1 30S ribosomal protein S12 methylthiotransferase RimO [Clostridia bacterium]